jgi:hypothetical protein
LFISAAESTSQTVLSTVSTIFLWLVSSSSERRAATFGLVSQLSRVTNYLRERNQVPQKSFINSTDDVITDKFPTFADLSLYNSQGILFHNI